MFGFLGFILLFIFIIIIVALALVGNIVRFIFGLGRRTPKQYNHRQTSTNDYTSQQQTTDTGSSTTGKKKIFGEDEGEYVEFEEVK